VKGLLFTYLLSYGGAVASLVNPFAGLLIYIVFGIIKPERTWYWSVPPGNYSRIVAIGLLTGWALVGFGSWRFGRARQIIVTLVLFMAWLMVSAAFAPAQEIAWADVEGYAKIVLPMIVGVTLIDSVQKLRALAWTIVLTLGYLAFEENQKYFAGGIGVGDNYTAHQAAVGIGAAFFLGVSETAWSRRLLAFACAALMAHTVMFHMSRGGMLGLIGTGIMIFVVIPKRPEHVVVLVVALLVTARLAGPSVREEFSTIFASEEERDASAESRFDLWVAMSKETVQNPIVGLGPNHWPLVAERHGFKAGKQGHALWSQMTAELGIPGGLLYFSFFMLTIWKLWPIARQRISPPGDPSIGFARMAICSIFGFVSEAQFGSFDQMEAAYYVTLLGAATVCFHSSHSPGLKQDLASSTPASARDGN
jgi:O-antigen ligase